MESSLACGVIMNEMQTSCARMYASRADTANGPKQTYTRPGRKITELCLNQVFNLNGVDAVKTVKRFGDNH